MNSYDDEYNISKGLFWECLPAKYVKIFAEKKILDLTGSKVLDMGAGEGKNTIFLAKQGAYIDAVDLSKTALLRITNLPEYEKCHSQINLINEDILEFETTLLYDLVICYGLIHALPDREQALSVINKLKSFVKKGGYIIIATFNNLLPPPSVQPYLKIDAFLNTRELNHLFNKWEILDYEENIITETHNTSKIEHQHSISRLIAKKNG